MMTDTARLNTRLLAALVLISETARLHAERLPDAAEAFLDIDGICKLMIKQAGR